MRLYRNSLVGLSCLAIGMMLNACGAQPSLRLPGQVQQAASATTQAVPEASAFKIIEGKVSKILPDDTKGLPHQNFVVTAVVVDARQAVTVNHNTFHGTRVKNLKVGQTLTIRGVMYRSKNRGLGIHWTHKANKAGDAGYIKTADGVVYQ